MCRLPAALCRRTIREAGGRRDIPADPAPPVPAVSSPAAPSGVMYTSAGYPIDPPCCSPRDEEPRYGERSGRTGRGKGESRRPAGFVCDTSVMRIAAHLPRSSAGKRLYFLLWKRRQTRANSGRAETTIYHRLPHRLCCSHVMLKCSAFLLDDCIQDGGTKLSATRYSFSLISLLKFIGSTDFLIQTGTSSICRLLTQYVMMDR